MIKIADTLDALEVLFMKKLKHKLIKKTPVSFTKFRIF